MKSLLPALLLFALTPLLSAQELKTGEPLTASDLAKQLNVQNWTFVYNPGKEVSQIRYKLVYRSRETKDGEFTEDVLSSTTTILQSPVKKLPVTLCVDKTQSTMIYANGASAGRGVDVPVPNVKYNTLLKQNDANGRYVLMMGYFPLEPGSDDEVIKSTLELEISGE